MRPLPLAAALVCLAAAGFYAGKVDVSAAPSCGYGISRLSPAEVEKSLGEAHSLMKAGKSVEALLILEGRAKSGDPTAGAALYLLGEMAYAEGAFAKAVDRYIEAVKADPSLTDRVSPFGAAETIGLRSKELRAGRWAGADRPAEALARLNYLDRRLGGGCK